MFIVVMHGNEEVAIVNTPEEVKDVDVALEIAYEKTQNIFGSWSLQKLPDNPDADPENVIVLKDMRNAEYGLRSTMVGDRLIVVGTNNSNTAYEVASFGFERREI